MKKKWFVGFPLLQLMENLISSGNPYLSRLHPLSWWKKQFTPHLQFPTPPGFYKPLASNHPLANFTLPSTTRKKWPPIKVEFSLGMELFDCWKKCREPQTLTVVTIYRTVRPKLSSYLAGRHFSPRVKYAPLIPISPTWTNFLLRATWNWNTQLGV